MCGQSLYQAGAYIHATRRAAITFAGTSAAHGARWTVVLAPAAARGYLTAVTALGPRELGPPSVVLAGIALSACR